MMTTKYVDAVVEAKRLGTQNVMPLAKFRNGQDVSLDSHDADVAIVLRVNFHPVIWMFSYTVNPSGQDQVLEVMEWGISEIKQENV